MKGDLLHTASTWLQSGPSLADSQQEIYVFESKEESLSWSQGALSRLGTSMESGGCVRLISKGKLGVGSQSGLDPAGAKAAFDLAEEGARLKNVSYKGRFSREKKTVPLEKKNLPDPLPLDEKKNLLADLDRSVLELDPRIKSVIRQNWTERNECQAIGTKAGFLGGKAKTTHTFMVEVLAKEGGESQVAWDFFEVSAFSRDRFKKAVMGCGKRAVEALGAESIATQKIPILVSPAVAVQILSLLSKALSGEEVLLSRSFLKNLIGRQVASPCFSLLDDGLLSEGVATAPFDDEGTSQQTKPIFESGILQSFFHTLRSAEETQSQPTGNGLKAGWMSSPQAFPTNLYIKPGKTSPEDLRSQEPLVLEVKEIMGLHMADPITGEFSFGASGVLWERGRKKSSVRGVTWAGSLTELLLNITEVGSNLTWFGSLGSPSFLTRPLSISGR